YSKRGDRGHPVCYKFVWEAGYMKENNQPTLSTLIGFILPLVLYEITFALFVVYYSRQDASSFRITYLAMCIAFITSFIRIVSCYRKWGNAYATDRKVYFASLLSYFTSFIVYLFSLFIQTHQWNELATPSLLVLILLGIPPLLEFIIFLVAGTPVKKS
ncbi:MAG: hypothetical protein ABW019_09440, partial [Chitinophagaceae bacterium]